VIDDDPLVRTSVERMLRGADTVVGFGTAQTALKHLTTDGAFDAILCDLMMPDAMGPDFQAEVTRLDASLSSRFVFMTGGAFTSEARVFLSHSHATCLDKPFTQEALHLALMAVASHPDEARRL
jgi:CheY-like chemotaxis protein